MFNDPFVVKSSCQQRKYNKCLPFLLLIRYACHPKNKKIIIQDLKYVMVKIMSIVAHFSAHYRAICKIKQYSLYVVCSRYEC